MKNLNTPNGLMFTGPNPPAHLAEQMNTCWYNFAKTGKPSVEGVEEWPVYTAEDRADCSSAIRSAPTKKPVTFMKSV